MVSASDRTANSRAPGCYKVAANFKTGRRRSGRSRSLTMIDGEAAEELRAVVTRADRPAVLEYTWDTDLLRWELSPTESGTRLTLRHTVQDLEWVPKVAAGWHICLAVVERLLDGKPVGPIVGENAKNYGWDALHDRYAEKLLKASRA